MGRIQFVLFEDMWFMKKPLKDSFKNLDQDVKLFTHSTKGY